MSATIWTVCIVSMIALFVFAVVLLFFDVARNGLKRAFTRTTILSLVAGWIGLLPVRLADSLSPLEGIIRNFYDVLDLLKLSVNISEAETAAVQALGTESILPPLYAFALSLLSILVPLVVISSVVSGLREIAQRYKLAILGMSRDTAYVFADSGRASALLARDIIAHAPGKPFIVFCNSATGLRADPIAEEIRSGNRGNAVFTANEVLDTLSRLGRFDEVHCFALSEDCNANVERSAAVVRWMRSLKGAGDVAEITLGQRKRKRLSTTNWFMYCLHCSTVDELLFDSLYASEVDANVRVRLISRDDERTWGLLTEKPLYEALAPANAEQPQDLLVCIVGLGATGLGALRSSYWMGRCGDALRLHIAGIDKNAAAIAASLRAQSPAMMAETDPKTGKPVVSLLPIEEGTDAMVEFVNGIPSSWGVYCVVASENSAHNLETAIELRRLFLQRAAEGSFAPPAQPVIATFVRNEETYRATEALVSDRNEPYSLTPFGKDRDIFSYANIVDSAWEKRALAMNAAYDECWVDPADAQRIAVVGLRGSSRIMSAGPIEAEYGASEIKKLSNRVSVRHAPYKLWCLGLESSFDHGRFVEGSFTNEQWLETLGITAEQADALFEDVAVEEGAHLEGDDLRKRLERIQELSVPVSVLANAEHDRWCAYYRAHGWDSLAIEDIAGLEQLGVMSKPGDHQSAILKRHSYICSAEELLERGAQLGEDPFRYDRAAVVELRRILTADLLAE